MDNYVWKHLVDNFSKVEYNQFYNTIVNVFCKFLQELPRQETHLPKFAQIAAVSRKLLERSLRGRSFDPSFYSSTNKITWRLLSLKKFNLPLWKAPARKSNGIILTKQRQAITWLTDEENAEQRSRRNSFLELNVASAASLQTKLRLSLAFSLFSVRSQCASRIYIPLQKMLDEKLRAERALFAPKVLDAHRDIGFGKRLSRRRDCEEVVVC